jgi:hypothetical protein
MIRLWDSRRRWPVAGGCPSRLTGSCVMLFRMSSQSRSEDTRATPQLNRLSQELEPLFKTLLHDSCYALGVNYSYSLMCNKEHNAARRNTHTCALGRTIHQQLSINAERRQFPHPQHLTPDDDHFGRNMS